MRSGKHIAWLVPGFAADESDDSCIPVLQVLPEEFMRHHPEFRFTVIAFQYPSKENEYKWKGITVYPCNGQNKKGVFRFQVWRKAMHFFRNVQNTDPFDVIHSFWLSECAVVGERLSKKFRVPHFTTLMGQDVLPSNRYLKIGALTKVPVVALCERHAQLFEKYAGRKPVAIIPWGVDATYKPDFSHERTIDLVAAGSFIPLKRFEQFIRLVAEVKKKFPGVRAAIAGDGPERSRLLQLAENLGLKDNLAFTGKISREKVLELMTRSRVFVHPSSFESFGFVYAEALQCGMSVVSYETGIASPSERWKVVSSKEEMVKAVIELLKKEGATSSVVPYAVNETAEKYAGLYEGYHVTNCP